MLFISIATYNEKDNIERLIHVILSLGIGNINLVIIDDCSPDGTGEMVSRLKKDIKNIYLIERSGKLGYGSAHIDGFKFALEKGAEIIISMDADFSHNPDKILELIGAIEEGNDVAIGSRRIAGGGVVGWNFWRKFCSAGAAFVSRLILGIETKDSTSGFRAYHRRVFEKINLDQIKSDGYSFLEEFIYLLEKNNFNIKEIPIIFYDRKFGKSKLSKREILKFFATVFKLKLQYWNEQ